MPVCRRLATSLAGTTNERCMLVPVFVRRKVMGITGALPQRSRLWLLDSDIVHFLSHFGVAYCSDWQGDAWRPALY